MKQIIREVVKEAAEKYPGEPLEAQVYAIRMLAKNSHVYKQAITEYALAVYDKGLWQERFGEWGYWVTYALGGTGYLSRHDLSQLRYKIPVLARLKANPVRKNGLKIDHAVFLNGRAAFLQEVLPRVSMLDLDNPGSKQRFDDLIYSAATMKMQELRDKTRYRPDSEKALMSKTLKGNQVVFTIACKADLAPEIERKLQNLVKVIA